MSENAIRVFAGECAVTYRSDDQPPRGDADGIGASPRVQYGEVVVLRKPDDTVLVHDADGYQPVAWLTRADTVHAVRDADGFELAAATDGARLRVESRDSYGSARYPGSAAGTPVGSCPDCGETLVRADGAVRCLGCRAEYGVPRQASVLEGTCSCGLPRMHVERGALLDICVDRDCESLDDAVRDRFDREWDCPACGDDLRILRRGGLIAGCEAYPDCDTGFGIPNGRIADTCDCGLPVFETASGRRCLDANCEAGAG